MMKSRNLTRSAVAFATLSCLYVPFNALAWDNLTVFGDSLSDGGNVRRFTYDGAQHPLYDEILAAQLGQTLQPSSRGGSNYAQGGGVTVPALDASLNTQDQLAAYLQSTGGRADSNGLYIHWVGANDIAAAVTNPLTARETISNSASAAVSQIKTLLDAGAGAVIVPNVPQLGSTPFMVQAVLSVLGPAAQSAMVAAFASLDSHATPDVAARQQAVRDAFDQAAAQISTIPALRAALAQQLFSAWQVLSEQVTALSDGYNQQEEAGLVALNGNIVRADIAGLFNEVIADPQRYGLSNTLGMACPVGTSAAECTSSTPGFSNAQAYLFADRLHPSPAVHAMIADYIQSILDAPAQVAALARAPLMLSRDMQNTLDGHLQQQRQQPASAGQVSVFGGYAGQHIDYRGDSLLNGDANTGSLTLGLGYQFTDNWQAGLLLSSTAQHQHPSAHYDYKLRGNLLALYSQLTLLEQGWINADVHYADLDFDSIERRINIGPATRTEQGSSSGKMLGLRVQTGWDLPIGEHLSTGPVASYALDYVRAGGYSENGDSSTAMRFSDQTLHSQIGALGWRIDSKQWPVNPWAQLSYNHQFGDTQNAVRAGLKSTQTGFVRSVSAGDKNWLDMSLGASVPLGETVNAFAGVSAVGGNSAYHQLSWNIGLNATF
ncbi:MULTISPECIES: autotransporter outer membrane beta-barrel domain-containing protein [Pantoea]|uniref:autotransporter outer membrane beta-barrel domain-containing protein n=1 Tax=Pantoea TaxID=53335 RepID=UPI000CE43C18|nr:MULTISPECIES: autotransporter domain-containing protein [Pantoea]MCI1027730.1 autotransporter domain-containing protein [Pantoea dispersa]MDR6295280.1 outer membrane lipase/esterase [Pantoea dispersa]NIE51753.1 autotransporter domain-containing protein [Pantoea sp. Ap-870]NIG33841.1 autotransporter domain-containing protein [Pantoea sp. Ap-959]PPC69224.1 autotransporter domain-containing esterase [Pantoea sp. ICBG 828]